MKFLITVRGVGGGGGEKQKQSSSKTNQVCNTIIAKRKTKTKRSQLRKEKEI